MKLESVWAGTKPTRARELPVEENVLRTVSHTRTKF